MNCIISRATGERAIPPTDIRKCHHCIVHHPHHPYHQKHQTIIILIHIQRRPFLLHHHHHHHRYHRRAFSNVASSVLVWVSKKKFTEWENTFIRYWMSRAVYITGHLSYARMNEMEKWPKKRFDAIRPTAWSSGKRRYVYMKPSLRDSSFDVSWLPASINIYIYIWISYLYIVLKYSFTKDMRVSFSWLLTPDRMHHPFELTEYLICNPFVSEPHSWRFMACSDEKKFSWNDLGYRCYIFLSR